MVIDTGKEKEEEIIESVERGMVEKAEEYKCVGLWLNSEGNLKTHIEKKKRIVMGEVNAIKTLGSKENVGPLYLTTRLFLFEACIIPSLLYQIETWSPLLKKDELQQLAGEYSRKNPVQSVTPSQNDTLLGGAEGNRNLDGKMEVGVSNNNAILQHYGW